MRKLVYLLSLVSLLIIITGCSKEKEAKNEVSVKQENYKYSYTVSLTENAFKNFDETFPNFKDKELTFNSENRSVDLYITKKEREVFEKHKEVTGITSGKNYVVPN